MKVQTPALISKIATKADGSIQVVLETPELPPNEMSKLFELRKAQGWFLFSENTFSEEDIPKEQADVGEGKSPAQRLRATLYVVWNSQGRKGDFEAYYRTAIERMINIAKERIEE